MTEISPSKSQNSGSGFRRLWSKLKSKNINNANTLNPVNLTDHYNTQNSRTISKNGSIRGNKNSHNVKQRAVAVVSPYKPDLDIQYYPQYVKHDGSENPNELHLDNQQLTHLPASICSSLPFLTLLNLSKNELRTINDSMKHLKQLQILNISLNALNILPNVICGLNTITDLCLMGCGLQQINKSIGSLINLRHLDLSHNQINSLPSSLGRLKQLETLQLQRNQMNKLPESIGDLSCLDSLNVSWNELLQLPLSVWRLPLLSSLQAANNYFSSLPVQLEASSLRHLDVSQNQLRSLPDCDQSNIRDLSLDGNLLTVLSDTVARFTQLRRLSVRHNHLQSITPDIGQLIHLEELWLSGNQLADVPRQISGCRRLRILDLSHNHLADLPDVFGSLQQLIILDVRGNQLSVLPYSLLPNVPRIRAVWMSERQDSGKAPLLPTLHGKRLALTSVHLPQQQPRHNDVISSSMAQGEHASWSIPAEYLLAQDRVHNAKRLLALELCRLAHSSNPDRLEQLERAVHLLPTAVHRLNVPIRPYAMVDMDSLQAQVRNSVSQRSASLATAGTLLSLNPTITEITDKEHDYDSLVDNSLVTSKASDTYDSRMYVNSGSNAAIINRPRTSHESML